jgi:two-component system chemotaxis sensor kinase CheA
VAYNSLQTFLQEAEELIAEIEEAALALSRNDASAETVNRLFRAFHTIKGSGGMCGLDDLSAFTHHVENLLDRVREGAIPITAELTKLVLDSTDHIKVLLNAAENARAVPPSAGEGLIAAISAFTNGEATAAPVAKEMAPAAQCTWRIKFHPDPALLANGGNPAALLRELRELGSCEVVAHVDEIPSLEVIQPDRCYLWWTITLHAAIDENAIRDVFIFVEDGSQLEVEAIEGAPQPELAATGKAAEGGATARKKPTKEATVRVPAERLDHLVNLVGEFVMNQSCLAQAVSQSTAPEFANPVQVLERLVAELRDNVLGIRMLPIGTLFGRFARVVHDLSSELGKEVDLVTEGAETELDKSILDQLSEPLVHCLRNCLDHGIEPAAERVAKGKLARATVRLSAEHAGSSVVISISDDGRGIDRQAVRAKAIEKQLIGPAAVLTDKDIFNLILLPGFSTARQVTNVSGRGVGMDAVKRQIDLLRGAVHLDSRDGKGARVWITLPLTLAIIDGLLVQIGEERFIIPMTAVTENVELSRAERARNNGRNVLAVRGELIPYIDLRAAFQVPGVLPPIEKVVIVRHGDDRVGLVVERVLGTHQTVIQSLGKFFRKVDVVSGATIMGDGRVALIIDVAAVVRHADRECREALAGAELVGC